MTLHTRDDWAAAVVLFNGQVIHAYQNGDMYGTDKMIFAAKTGAETWNYPVIQPSVAVNEADGADVTLSGAAFQGNSDDIITSDLPVDAPMKDIRLLPLDQIEVRPELRLPDNYAQMLGRSLAEGKGIRITGLLANSAAGTPEQVLPVDATNITTVGELGIAIKEAINLIGSGMDEFGVPSEGRHIMLRSLYWYELLGVEGIFTKEFGGQANVQAPGQFVDYANFKIWNAKVGFGIDFTASPWDARLIAGGSDPAKYRYDATNLMAVAWHEEAWAMRHWVEPTIMNDWVPLRNSFKLEARLTMGAIEIQHEGVWALEDSTS